MNTIRYITRYVSGTDTFNVIDLQDDSIVQTCEHLEAVEAANALQGVEDLDLDLQERLTDKVISDKFANDSDCWDSF